MPKLKVPETLFRSAEFDRASVDEDNRTVRLSVSSDAPYERFFGTEILKHDAASIRLARLRKAGAVLFNHDRDQHIGRVLSAEPDGKKLNVIVKFGNSPLAKEKFQDIQDGILGEASIGYEIHKMEEDADAKSFTATDWEPYECSFVTVPADPSVGIGRAQPDWNLVRSKELEVDNSRAADAQRTDLPNNPQKSMAETVAPEIKKDEPKVDVVKERNSAVEEFQDKCDRIFKHVAAIKNQNWRAKAHEIAVKYTGKGGTADFEAFRTESNNAFDPAKDLETPTAELGMSKKERKQFSIRKLLLEIGTKGAPTGLEKEATDAARERLRDLEDKTINERTGLTLPEDLLSSNMAEDHDLGQKQVDFYRDEFRRMFQTRAGLNASTQNVGGYLVGVDLMTGSIIELLRHRTVMANLGITNLDGLVNNVAIPRVLGGATVYWLAEGASVTASNQTFGQLTLSPHRMGADTYFTKQLLAQASLSVEAFVRDDLVRQMAVELDRVYINGTGLGGEPQGILNTPGIGSITFSTSVTFAKLCTIESDIAVADADTLGSQAIITTPAARAKLKSIVAFTSTASPLWDRDNMVNGYPAYVSNNVPSNKLIQGVPSEFIAGRWAGLDVVVDPYSLKKSEQIEVTMHQWVDCGIRHPLAFEASTDSAAQ